MRRTKIICTIGPASNNTEIFFNMAAAGMNLIRLNRSHGTLQEHEAVINLAKKYRARTNNPLGILMDIRGLKIRLGTMKNKIKISKGDKYILTTEPVIGDEYRAGISFDGLLDGIKAGNDIFIDDGQINLRIISVNGQDMNCIVINGGTLESGKGINIPGLKLSQVEISSKDKEDILFGIRNEVDYIASSFVHTARDIIGLKEFIYKNGGEAISIIAKIETREAVENIDSIIEAADGIMVARGDLGVEMPVEDVPIVQKAIIKKCNAAGKPVIVATQMLDSMIYNPRPTRAEANDVANAIYESADAIMLSGETAIGGYPLETLETMCRIAQAVENSIDYVKETMNRQNMIVMSVTNAISSASCTIAINLGATAILTPTKSGYTASMISKYRPPCAIIALLFDSRIFNKLSLIWGVTPLLTDTTRSVEEFLDNSSQAALKSGMVNKGETVVITAGGSLNVDRTTDLIKVLKLV